MFTGIVTDIGSIVAAEQRGDLRLHIATDYDTAGIDLGASISCSGACLTVVDKGQGWFAVDVSAETLARTPKDRWQEGAKLNLERALKMGDELGGHLVTGHVDAVGTVVEVSAEGDSHRVGIRVPATIGRYLAPKGSVTVDGVSLTVNDVRDEGDITSFAVNVIPHTAGETTLGALVAGSKANIEIDVIARYLDRLIATRM